MTKLAGALPKSNNGLDRLNDELVADPTNAHVIVAMIDVSRITVNPDDETSEATCRILRIEPLTGKDADQAAHLLDSAYAHRTGQPMLPVNTFTGVVGDDEDSEDDD